MSVLSSSYSSNISDNTEFIKAVFRDCYSHTIDKIWLVPEILIMFAGLFANAVLLWLFVRDGKPLTASKVLGMNLVAMDLLYLLLMPVTVYRDVYNQELYANNSARNKIKVSNSFTDPLDVAADAISIINLVGCALLLAFMCVERFVAVARPLLYLTLGRREYRTAVSAGVWAVTTICCLFTCCIGGLHVVILPISILMSGLFLVMLASLGGVVWSLWQQSPAHSGPQAAPPVPLRRRAVWNVLAVVVPAVASYLPIVLLLPLLSTMRQSGPEQLGSAICNVLSWMVFFPKFALLIGPTFYLAKARQMLCLCGAASAASR